MYSQNYQKQFVLPLYILKSFNALEKKKIQLEEISDKVQDDDFSSKYYLRFFSSD